MANEKFHYFASSSLNWNVDTSLEKVLKKQRLGDRRGLYIANTCRIFKVPVDIKKDYQIVNFKPIVEGTEFLDKIIY